MKHPLEYDRQKTDRIIKDNFQSLLMNNKKWVKLIRVLSEDCDVKECKLKLVWDNEIRKLFLQNATYCFDYYDESMEAMVSGYPRRFYEYKEIEWLEFPLMAEVLVSNANLKAGRHLVKQNIDLMHSKISSIGEFELEKSKTLLKLYAYK